MIMMGMRLIKTKLNNMNEPTNSEALPLTTCSACGMLVGQHRNYHPHAACLMFRGCYNGNTVDANLRAVVEYGMKAQAAGVPLEKAMDDITWRNCLPNASVEARQ